MNAANVESTTQLESALKRDRLFVGAALALTVILCWAWIVPMARDMYGPMTGASAWMRADTWGAPQLARLFGMWVAMMAGMMLPSAAPTLLLYARIVRRSPEGDRAPGRTHLFAAGYLAIWTAFSVVATVLQRVLSDALWLSPMMALRSRTLGASLLIIAGIYQLTPIKGACLSSCQSPLAFIFRHWQTGDRGAFRMGVVHGLNCLGCCWALMLLLFVGGVMNLYVIAAITLLVLAEKVLPWAGRGTRLSGSLLIVAGAAMLAVSRSG